MLELNRKNALTTGRFGKLHKPVCLCDGTITVSCHAGFVSIPSNHLDRRCDSLSELAHSALVHRPIPYIIRSQEKAAAVAVKSPAGRGERFRADFLRKRRRGFRMFLAKRRDMLRDVAAAIASVHVVSKRCEETVINLLGGDVVPLHGRKCCA